MKTQRNSLRYVAILVLIGCSISLIGISPETVEACEAADEVCEKLGNGALKKCAKHGFGTWKCIIAIGEAAAACIITHRLLCDSSS